MAQDTSFDVFWAFVLRSSFFVLRRTTRTRRTHSVSIVHVRHCGMVVAWRGLGRLALRPRSSAVLIVVSRKYYEMN
jgi:hypothetical protein